MYVYQTIHIRMYVLRGTLGCYEHAHSLPQFGILGAHVAAEGPEVGLADPTDWVEVGTGAVVLCHIPSQTTGSRETHRADFV